MKKLPVPQVQAPSVIEGDNAGSTNPNQSRRKTRRDSRKSKQDKTNVLLSLGRRSHCEKSICAAQFLIGKTDCTSKQALILVAAGDQKSRCNSRFVRRHITKSTIGAKQHVILQAKTLGLKEW